VIVIRVSLNSQNPLTIPPASSASHAGESPSPSLPPSLSHSSIEACLDLLLYTLVFLFNYLLGFKLPSPSLITIFNNIMNYSIFACVVFFSCFFLYNLTHFMFILTLLTI
jgi:hypothetical protein